MTGMRGSVAVARIPARSDRWLLSDAALKFRAPAGSLHVRPRLPGQRQAARRCAYIPWPDWAVSREAMAAATSPMRL